jgi:hypothetical protein
MTLKTDGIPFVSRTSANNGISAKVEPIPGVLPNPANTISISGGGSVLECFVQELPYYSGRDLFYLKPKTKVDKTALFFICTIIKLEKYRFNYGRQANKSLRAIKIKLPAIKGSPDWNFMEYYIKSLPYTSNLEVTPKQGLSDEELIEKYEGGKIIEFNKVVKTMIKTPAPGVSKREKK